MNYADRIIHDQMIQWLVEPIIQEKTLSHVKDRDSLMDSIAFIDTLEKAKWDTLTLVGLGALTERVPGQ